MELFQKTASFFVFIWQISCKRTADLFHVVDGATNGNCCLPRTNAEIHGALPHFSLVTDYHVATDKHRLSRMNTSRRHCFSFANCLSQLEPYPATDTPTDIRMVETDVDEDAPRYNLSGQRVGRDYKGVVIKKGKKVMSGK